MVGFNPHCRDTISEGRYYAEPDVLTRLCSPPLARLRQSFPILAMHKISWHPVAGAKPPKIKGPPGRRKARPAWVENRSVGTAASVKVFGCRSHDGGAAGTGVGVRKPPREETAGGVTRSCVRRYGDFDAGGVLPRCDECFFGRRPMKRRARSAGRDMRNRSRAAVIERHDGYRGWREGEPGHCWSRAGEADGQSYYFAAHRS